MMNKLFLVAATLAAFTTVSYAAPKTKIQPASATSLLQDAPLPPPDMQTGVDINAVTRNNTASKYSLQLAKGGKALVPIVISDKASDATKAVAADIKKFLDQMTDADFKIQTGDGSEGIVIGSIKEFPTPALDNALEIKHGIDGKDAYAIRTRDKRLLILGATDLGASHGAYRVLNELGCRWFFPDATGDWTVIPKIKDLKFGREITDRPAFLERRIWYSWSWFSDAGHPLGAGHSSAGDFDDWSRRNSMASSFTTNAGHALQNIIGANQAEFTAHPEYYALTGGKRQGPQIEMGNPKVREMVLEYARNFFKQNPNADMVSVDPADGGGYSTSPETIAWAGDPVMAPFKLANEVAVMLQKEFPGKMVGLYAYNWHTDPPKFALEPNVYVQLTMGFNGGLLSLDQLFDEWPTKTKNLGFYDYYSTWRWDYDVWPGGRVGNKNYSPVMIRRFQKANAVSKAYATSISAESSGNWGVNGRGYYLANKMMWNPQLDVDGILDDFYDKAFGPAAAAMKKYYGYQDASPPISPGVVGALFRAMDEARQAAKNDPAVMQRLDDLSIYLHYYDVTYGGNYGAPDNGTERWRTAYRSRYKYMNHWAAIVNDALHDTGDPKAVWRDETPITHEEVAGWIAAGVKRYPELKIPDEVKFSDDLVTVDFGGEATDNTQLYQEGSVYLVQSLKGEPIHLKATAGGAYGGLRQNVTIQDMKGKTIKEFKPKPGEEINMDIPVPGPGIYKYTFADGGAYHQIYWNKDQIVSLPLSAGAFRAMSHIEPMYFYVPKGTKEINYYYKRADWQWGGAQVLYDSTGKVVKEVAVDGDYVSVPVPAGQDGKVWKIGGPSFGLGSFRFFDVPGYFSPNPNKMILPKDVVAQDGLKVLK
ncbi:MAG: DUF4838 domain-containing protein [Abditibacteriaceae bacterium]